MLRAGLPVNPAFSVRVRSERQLSADRAPETAGALPKR
jgi:hypothetical protein